jgi:amino acid transporter
MHANSGNDHVPPEEQSHSTRLQRSSLGAGVITLLVISAASVLSVVAGGFPLGIMLGDGAGTPALVLVALVLLLLFAAGYTAMSTCTTSAGGFYALIARGLGGRAGGAAAMVAVLGYLSLQFGLYGMFGAVASETLHAQFGLEVPWALCAIGAIVTVACCGYSKIDFSARALAVFVVVEYLVVLTLDVLILCKGGADGINFASFSPAVIAGGNPSIGLLFCFAAFIGFEATTIYGEEAKDPKRSVPLATYWALLLVGGFYSFSLWCLVLGAGVDRVASGIAALQEPTNFLYVLSEHYAGSLYTVLLRGMFILSIYAGLIAFHNSTARYLYSMGREGLLPRMLGWTHPRYRSPYIASLLQTALCTVVVLAWAVFRADPILTLFSWLSNLATLCVLALMIGAATSAIVYFRRAPHEFSVARTIVLPAASALALSVVLLLAVWNFNVLTGASSMLSMSLIVLVPIAGVLGWQIAGKLQQRDPDRYQQLGQDRG